MRDRKSMVAGGRPVPSCRTRKHARTEEKLLVQPIWSPSAGSALVARPFWSWMTRSGTTSTQHRKRPAHLQASEIWRTRMVAGLFAGAILLNGVPASRKKQWSQPLRPPQRTRTRDVKLTQPYRAVAHLRMLLPGEFQ